MNTTAGIIQRKSLMKLLDSLSAERFVYVSAPAGYGKTVTIKQWLERTACKNAIISLDEYDNKPVNLCVQFCAALRSCQKKNNLLVEIISHPAFKTAPDEFTFHAISALDDSKDATIVIDDLHYISDKQTQNMLLGFLKRLPEKMRVIILSRNKLPDCLLELWLKNSIVCITAEQLRFSIDEITQLYEKRGRNITSAYAAEILKYTNGWAIGIGAMLLSGEVTDEFLTGRLEYLDKFIRENIWKKWDKSTREFMLKTSVTRDMTPMLCDALTGNENSGHTLERLVFENTFITCSQEGVYTYHHLFRSFLQTELKQKGNQYYGKLMKNAGDWYLSNADFYNAIDCFILCENHEGIAKCFGLLVTQGHEYFLVDKLIQVANSSLIYDTAQMYPYIYSILSWAAFNEGRAEDMACYADKYYLNQEKIIQLDPRLELNIAFVKLIDFRQTLFELSLLFGSENSDITTKKLSDMGVDLGIINQNMPYLHRGTRDFSECALGDVEKNIQLMKGAFGWLFGEQAEVLSECLLAGLLYERGFLEGAHRHAINASAKITGDCVPEIKFCSMSILCKILDALGQHNEAEGVLNQIASMIEKNKAYFFNYNFNALKIRRKLASGDMKAAKEWLNEHETGDRLDFYRLFIHITTSRAYIANGNFDEAAILLKKALELSEKYKRPLDIIEINLLLSIAYWKRKRNFKNEAIRYLEDAVTEAHNYGFVQLFINEGAEVRGMLQRLEKRIRQPQYKGFLPATFVKYLCNKALECPNSGITSGQLIKVDTFTQKQKNVMELLYAGKTHREIAEALGVSRTTVRSHISSIYAKMDVTNESDAIRVMESFGIFR